MSEQPKDERAPEQTAAESEYAQTAATGEAFQAEIDAHSQTADYEAVVRLVKENEEYKDRALRLAAEMENLRRRTARDVQDARAYAIANFAREMLQVSDNLTRALDAIPAEAKESGDAGFKALIEGVELTGRSMLSALERHGVKKLDPEGEKFDPNFHQAMFEVPNPDIASGTVVQVVQTGFVIGDRVLRPAMVGVSKGGPKQVAEPSTPVEPGPPNEQAEKDA
ncbi:nucleotide exchange factor GrpE [Aerobium aerolatum]|uniref:Protein GrpE n=1 Tax=Aquamicrobium aerolatum DSM 21857 TaxID=1121003 RepID=A0A1I3PUS7_9HYPH|nr:nucleotide exchange factor GrpE [Aquamicrobium aerolatum]SFJ24686.1 molecular chaperone GrpE [Aquamicrobium aerolatum DSM 21857]